MPKLLYTWYYEKFTASVTSSGHSALRHEVSRICTILTIGNTRVSVTYYYFYDNIQLCNVMKVTAMEYNLWSYQ